MLLKTKISRILKENIKNIWLFRAISLLCGIFILYFLYRNEIIAIAFINGQPITLSDIVKVYSSPDENNFLDRIISEKVIEYEAKKRNIKVMKEEIEEEVLKIEREALANGNTLAQILEESDQTTKDLEKNIRLRIIIYKILSENIELSEEEIDRFVRDNPELYESLSEEETRDEVRKLLIDAKIKEEYKTWIREAKASSEIRYLIKLR